MIGEECVNKLNGMYISLDTIYRRIDDTSADTLDQTIQEMKSSTLPIFSIELDEYTEVENGSQLLVYSRYIHDSVFKMSFSSINVLKQPLHHVIYMKKFVHF
ncbi:SCAN domain-containing protein 3 [Thelohanellus kitauei]|uniref:SCAN domain-containing protein 3 n=1 Tax=Thelohanellus kitauei TaxID=669202 RepID=A0A0C2MGF1_THEKT|nr:SCAN domain-containing protein 3 [Thelohanellus kitauei]